MDNLYNWNPVFNFFMKVKYEYIKTFGNISYENGYIKNGSGATKTISCIEKWILELDNKEYIDMISALQLNQKDDLILIRYGMYSNVFSGEKGINNDNFWDLYDGFYKECRSLVINIEDDEIVLCPFAKFQNLNETEYNSLDNITNLINNAKSIEIADKLDGSMQSARYYSLNNIIMSGSQAIDRAKSWRLKDGYKMLLSQKNYIEMLKDNQDYTFIFEYISLKDAHVVCYTKEEEGLYLLGMRNVFTGEQLSYKQVKEIANEYKAKTVKTFNKTFSEVLGDLDKYKSNEKEGYVISIDGYLLKIKMNDYVQIHKILSKISSVNLIIKNIGDNTYDDLISKIPINYRDRASSIAKLVFSYINNMDKEIKWLYGLAPKDSRKEFMIWVDTNVDEEFNTYLKKMYLGKPIDFIKKGNEKTPSYKTLKEMGIVDNYSTLFDE